MFTFPLFAPLLLALPFLGLPGVRLQIDWTDFRAVLVWLAGVGAPYIVGQLLSYLAENWPKWHELPRPVKFAAPLVLSVLLSVGATVLLRYDDVIGLLSPYWAIVVGAVLFYLGSQVAYMNAKKAGYGYGPKLAEKNYIREIESLSGKG
jgi:hypothetical protein